MAKKVFFLVFLSILFSGFVHFLTSSIQAQVQTPITISASAAPTPVATPVDEENFLPLPEIESPISESTREATLAATIVDPSAKQSIQEKKDQDITEVTSTKSDLLAAYLLEKPLKNPSWYNFLQIAIRKAVNRGLPSNILVLLLLFPLVATIIAFSRHVIGLRGFGVYTPAVLSVVFVSTGIPIGLIIFLLIVIASILLHKLFRRFNLAHLPKTALTLWGICVIIIGFLLVMAYFRVETFYALTIFPLLILVSLSENFTSTQLMSSAKEAAKLTLETLLLAVIGTFIIGNNNIQKLTIINPELVLLVSLVANILIGRYTGLRLLELIRFQSLIHKK